MPYGVRHERYFSLQNKTHGVRLTNVINFKNVRNVRIFIVFGALLLYYFHMNLMFNIGRLASTIFYRSFFRFSVTGLENIPKKGSLLIFSNHASMFDPPAVGLSIWSRPTWYMARDTLFKNPFAGALLRSIHAIPLNRGTGFRGGYEKVKNVLNNGGAVIAFPEGTRSPDGKLQKGKAGVGMLMYESRAAVIPCYIKGSADALPKGKKMPKLFTKMSINFGPAINLYDIYAMPDEKQTYQLSVDRVMDRIAEIKRSVEEL